MGGSVGNGKHHFPEHPKFGKLPAKHIPAIDPETGKVRKRSDGSIIYEVSRTAHILTAASRLLPGLGRHLGSKPLRKLARTVGRAAAAIGQRTAVERLVQKMQ